MKACAGSVHVAGVSKRYATADSPYTPTLSIFAWLRGARRLALPTGGAGEPPLPEPDVVDIDDDVDDDVDDDEDFQDGGQDGGAVDAPSSPSREWALRDVSFEVGPGGALAVLGPKRAGRTTLIRLLAGVSSPSDGTVALRGTVVPTVQIADRLMRPTTTARANVAETARLLGVPGGVIRRNVDEVLAFAGIPAVAQPSLREAREVYRRLAMAAAVCMEPGVILLDELPISSDEDFQRRWLERLEECRRAGAAIVLATRYPGRARQICEEAILLADGLVADRGDVQRMCGETAGGRPNRRPAVSAREGAEPDAPAVPGRREPVQREVGFSRWAALLGAEACDTSGAPVDELSEDEDLVLRIRVECARQRVRVRWSVEFTGTAGGVRVEQPEPALYDMGGMYLVTVRLPAHTLPPDVYRVRVEGEVAFKRQTVRIERDVLAIEIEPASVGADASSLAADEMDGATAGPWVIEDAEWTVEREPAPGIAASDAGG